MFNPSLIGGFKLYFVFLISREKKLSNGFVQSNRGGTFLLVKTIFSSVYDVRVLKSSLFVIAILGVVGLRTFNKDLYHERSFSRLDTKNADLVVENKEF